MYGIVKLGGDLFKYIMLKDRMNFQNFDMSYTDWTNIFVGGRFTELALGPIHWKSKV